MKTKIAAALALFTGICVAAPSAYADPPKKDGGYEYKFEDDGLLGKDLGADTANIKVRPPGRKSLLQRPRVQFVQELLKSVENM